MASLSTRPNGHSWVFVKAANGKRRPIRLGDQSDYDAEEAERRLAKIEKSHHFGEELDRMTVAWIEGLPPVIRERVSRTGLLPSHLQVEQGRGVTLPPTPPPVAAVQDCSLACLLTKWRETLRVEEQTLVNYDRDADRITRFTKHLEAKPGESRRPSLDVRHYVPADGDRFAAWLLHHGRARSEASLSESTVSRTIGSVQRIFEFAVREQWRTDNPFEHLTRRGEFNEDRHVYVTPELVDHLVGICNDAELRAMIVLSRFAGMRGPSEFKGLLWADVDFDESWVTITAPKTKRYRNGKRRRAPLFARCVDQLNRLWDVSPDGVDEVLPRLGPQESSQLSERLEILCRQTGVALWDKPWTNMRASCETDWQVVEKMQPFETAAYMGHSAVVALQHYNRVAKDRIADVPPGLKGEAKHSNRRGPRRSTKRSASRRSQSASSRSKAL